MAFGLLGILVKEIKHLDKSSVVVQPGLFVSDLVGNPKTDFPMLQLK